MVKFLWITTFACEYGFKSSWNLSFRTAVGLGDGDGCLDFGLCEPNTANDIANRLVKPQMMWIQTMVFGVSTASERDQLTNPKGFIMVIRVIYHKNQYPLFGGSGRKFAPTHGRVSGNHWVEQHPWAAGRPTTTVGPGGWGLSSSNSSGVKLVNYTSTREFYGTIQSYYVQYGRFMAL